MLTLTTLAQQIMDKVNDWNHPNDDECWSQEERNFINSISCSDGFWYGITDGWYIKPEMIVNEAHVRDLNKSELQELERIWSEISIEF